MNANRQAELDVTVTAATGAGSTTLTIPSAKGYIARTLTVKKPSANPDYVITISDSDGFVIYSSGTMTGNSAKAIEVPMRKSVTVAISGATVDGAYSVRLWGDFPN